MKMVEVLSTGRSLFDRVRQKAQTLEEDLKARREVDLSGLVAGVRARLEERLPSLRPLTIEADLQDRRGPAGIGRVRTSAWQADGLRKVVLSHVSLPPVVEGLALTLLPSTDLDFPIFAADLMALPTRISANADVYGKEWQTRGLLEAVHPGFLPLGSGPGPLWSARLGSGQGLHAKLSPRMVEPAFAALNQALACFLDKLHDAPPGRSSEAQQLFFHAFHNNGPRKGPLSLIMGEAWSERYSRLVFE